MALFKTTNELRLYVPFSISFNFDNVLPFIKKIESEVIIPVLGTLTYDALNAAYNANNLTADQSALLDKVRSCLAPLSLLEWIPFGQVLIHESGISITSNDNNKTAFAWQIEDLKKSNEMLGCSAKEELIIFLESKKNIYTDWASSDERKILFRNFVNTAREFTKYLNISANRKTFDRIRDVLSKVEDSFIKPVLCKELYSEIKSQILSGSITEDNKNLLEFIKPAITSLTISEATSVLPFDYDAYGLSIVTGNTGARKSESSLSVFNKDKISILKQTTEKDGLEYVEQLRQYLYDNADTYPLFKNSPCHNTSSSSAQVESESSSAVFFT